MNGTEGARMEKVEEPDKAVVRRGKGVTVADKGFWLFDLAMIFFWVVEDLTRRNIDGIMGR